MTDWVTDVATHGAVTTSTAEVESPASAHAPSPAAVAAAEAAAEARALLTSGRSAGGHPTGRFDFNLIRPRGGPTSTVAERAFLAAL